MVALDKDNEMECQADREHGVEEAGKEEVEGSKPPYKPEYQYTREELLKFTDHPLSRRKPVITDPAVDSLSCWLHAGWTAYKRSDTPTDRGDDSYKRRPNDPRERVRKEQEGIVLSPQRRNFNSGCFVSVAPNQGQRPRAESPIGSNKDGLHREMPAAGRRIGSGRIVNRDWDYRDKENNDDGYSFRPSLGPNGRERDERFDVRRNFSGLTVEAGREPSRESLNREKEMRSGSVREDPRLRERSSRFTNDRRRYEPEEPEWFSAPPAPPVYSYCEIPLPPVMRRGPNFHVLRTVAWSPLQLPLPRPCRPARLCVPYVKTFGGPTSQHDTIELRGFDDANDVSMRSKPKAISKSSSKNNVRDSNSNAGSRKSSTEEVTLQAQKNKEEARLLESPVASSTPKVDTTLKNCFSPVDNETSEESADKTKTNNTLDKQDFSLEDFLQLDNLPLLANGGAGEGRTGGSRFSQWFRRDSPVYQQDEDVRRSSLQDDLIKNIINDMTDTSINTSDINESDAYFAPISPAGTTSEAIGKVTSVEELEARMRLGVGGPPNQTVQHKKATRKEEELIAFKKLMLNKPPEPTDMMGQSHQSANNPGPMHVPQELVYKLLHVQQEQERSRQAQQQQQEMINKLLFSGNRLVPPNVHGALSPLPPELQVLVANSTPSAELLTRPEAQAILQGLHQGEITPQHLVQQLQNPAMQPRHREVLASILKLQGTSPRPASPLLVPGVVPPDQALLQQFLLQQQLRIPSPLPSMHSAYCPPPVISPNPLGTGPNTLSVQHAGLPRRVPSPRELMVHTQSIMQSALIKKKLEEQRENFRKRQELQRANSPNVQGGMKSPNPLPGTNSNSNCVNNNNNNNNSSSAVSLNNNGGESSKTTSSPTQMAFTPTSVLRKMTADHKECNDQSQTGNASSKTNFKTYQQQENMLKYQQQQLYVASQNQQQSSRIGNNIMPANCQQLGVRNPQQQWNMSKQPQQQLQGRAIVKGSSNYNSQQILEQQYRNQVTQNQLQYSANQRGSLFANQQRSKLNMTTSPMVANPHTLSQFSNFPSSANRVQPNRGPGYPAGTLGGLQQHNMNPSLQSFLLPQNSQQRNNFKTDVRANMRNSFAHFVPGSAGDGDLSTSPTANNQLTHWFTPELLAQAQSRPSKPDAALNMLSVEELERIQQNSAPVLN